MPFCWTSLFLPSDYATRPNLPLIRSTTRVFSRFVSSHGSRRWSPAFKTAIASPITAFSRRSAAICRFSPIGSSHPSSITGTRMPSPMFMSPPIPSRSYASAHFHTLVAEQPTSLATSPQRSPAMTRLAAPALTSSVYERRRRPCRGSRAIQFVRYPSDGYPSSAITFFSVMPSRKYMSTAFCLYSSLNTADSNPDTHASNFSSASPQLDVSYVQNWSVLGDIVYILRTIGTVLHPNGAY